MKIGDGQEVLRSGLDPLLFSQELALWAVAVSAGVVRYLKMLTTVALIHMAAKGRSPADFNGMHGPQLMTGQTMGCSVVGAALTKDIRHLDATRGTHRISGYDVSVA